MEDLRDSWFAGLEPRMVVLAPHADDEVLGAGGLMARAVRAGWQVEVGFAALSGFTSAYDGESSVTEVRESEVQAALKTLGVSAYDVKYRGEKFHLHLDTVARAELIGFVEGIIARVRPSVVVAPCGGHHHQDHQALADAAVAALRPGPDGGRPFVPVVWAYTHCAAGWGGDRFAVRPSVYVDISDVIEQKLQALDCYRSQVYLPPHPRSLDSVRAHHNTMGAYAGVDYAEAFENLRLRV